MHLFLSAEYRIAVLNTIFNKYLGAYKPHMQKISFLHVEYKGIQCLRSYS